MCFARCVRTHVTLHRRRGFVGRAWLQLLRIRRRLCVLLLLRTSTAYVSHCYVVSLFVHGHCMCVRAPRTSNGLVDLVCERLLALSIYHLLLTLDVLCAHTVQSVCFAFPHVCSHLSHVPFFFPSDRSISFFALFVFLFSCSFCLAIMDSISETVRRLSVCTLAFVNKTAKCKHLSSAVSFHGVGITICKILR